MYRTLPNYALQFSDGWTPYHDAAARGDDICLSKLSRNVSFIFQKSHVNGNTPLHEAAKRGFSRCVIVLCDMDHVQVKTNIDLKNNDGFSALHLAAQNGHNQCCRELLLRGSSPSICNNYGDTPLHTACRYGHAGVSRILLSAFSDCNKQNNNGDTALHITCAMGRKKLTKILLKSNSKAEIKNFQNETPVDIAKRKNYKELLHILQSKTLTSIGEGEVKLNSFFNEPIFSPYGCELTVDSRYIFLSNVEPLSQIKLDNGEQYYFDLAGNIQKGPKCIKNRCYCNPLKNHSN